jgi:hypothetical protein
MPADGTGLTLFGAAVMLSVVAGPADCPQIGPNDTRKATRTQRHAVAEKAEVHIRSFDLQAKVEFRVWGSRAVGPGVRAAGPPQ